GPASPGRSSSGNARDAFAATRPLTGVAPNVGVTPFYTLRRVMPANDTDKKTPSDVQEQKKPPQTKKVTVTWFKSEVSLTHPGMNHITSYQKGNKQMNGDKEFTWIPGSHYLEARVSPNRVAIIPIYGMMFEVEA